MKINVFLTAFLVTVAACAIPACASGDQDAKNAAPFAEKPEVRVFIDEMHAQYGFDAAALQRAFSSVRSNTMVLNAISPNVVPELKRAWRSYRQRFVNRPKIAEGVDFWKKNEASLVKAQAIYGVPPEIVVAIIGVETGYGRNAGKFSAFEALATLAFDYPPRAAFFKNELVQLLLLVREIGGNPLEYKASYAGAVGIPQFMPSSHRLYAVDFDGDKKIDLFRSNADAIGSVARYLSLHGWQAGGMITVPALVTSDPAPFLVGGLLPSAPLREFESRGARTATKVPEAAGYARVALIDLVDPDAPTEYWIAFNNFYVITRYNRASFYAMSVFQLSEALRAAKNSEAKAKPAQKKAPRPARRKK
ncbi:MAG: lytic murein transglycosylase B [Candidatus Accumulibacter sp.]|nr:lytic murein transglycosylase B [Accumulibacter sp.]